MILDLVILNGSDSGRHYSVCTGKGMPGAADTLVLDTKSYPQGSLYIDTLGRHLYSRVGVEKSPSDFEDLGGAIPVVGAVSFTDITADGVTVSGSFSYPARETLLTEVGVAIKVGEGEYTNHAAGEVASPFSVALTGLVDDTTYTIAGYVKIGEEIFYGATSSFEVLDSPNVTTTAVADITSTGANAGGSYVYEEAGNIGEIVEVGVEVKIDGGEFVEKPAAEIATPFVVALAELTLNSAYSVKAYVKIGTTKYYGETVTFNTLEA